ncbi:MAG: DUF480 domain-containing protein [Acidimicrobiia bacterium]
MTTVSAIEARILGVLVEKQMTTPDIYPLTLAGVVAGSNQSTNRDPVMSVSEREAEAALTRLHEIGLATPVRRPADRALKYRHKLTEALELDQPTLAVLAVLLLRGPQTVGELRQRTERYVTFDTIEDVERIVDRLEELDLARRLARQPGQSQRRVKELMSDGGTDVDQAHTPTVDVGTNELEIRVAALEKRFDELLRRLGVDDL